MKRYCGSLRVRFKSMLVLTAVLAVASATFASFAVADKGGSSVNNGGGTPSCGNSCDSSGNPTDFHKPCTPVPGNGCHTLPDTPCERGHGNAEEHNKHCAPETLAKFWLGYADTYFPRGTGLPSVWKGSPGVTFVGCGVNPNETGPALADTCPTELTNGTGGDSYDAGAIRIDNTSTMPLVVSGPASVSIGNCPGGAPAVYSPWPNLMRTIPAGGTLILTQTGLTGDPCGENLGGNYNFDTSESSGNGNCVPSGAIPKITLTINGSPTTILDNAQILNKGGVDPGACTAPVLINEFQEWTPVP
jgi:hypothetical protein